MYYSIKIIPTYTRLGQISSTRQAATPCRSAGDLYQALAGSNKHTLTNHRATCSQPVACEEYKAFALTSLCQRYSKLPRETLATKQHWPASQSNITVQYLLILSTCSCSLLRMEAKVWLQQEINFLLHIHACAISNLQAPNPRAVDNIH